MSNNCLVTKLKEVVNNDNLLHLGSILLKRAIISSEQTAIYTSIAFQDAVGKITLVSGHIYTDVDMTNEVTEVYPDNKHHAVFYTPSNENCSILIEEKYDLYSIGGDDKWNLNIKEMYDCTLLSDLRFSRLYLDDYNSVNLEDFIENNVGSSRTREYNMVIFIPNNYNKVLFNKEVLSSGNRYAFTENDNVFIYKTYTEGTYSNLLGTYNKITKEWHYE